MRRGVLALLVACAAAVAVLAMFGWPARAYVASDWMQYYAGSHALLEGASPYDAAWWRAFHERVGAPVQTGPPHPTDPAQDWTTPYPLWTFVLLLPFALLPIVLAAPAFAVAQVALVLVSAWALARALVPRRAIALAVLLVAASQPLWSLVAGGNMTGFAASAFTFALVAVIARRPFAAGVLLALCLVKPHVFVLAALAVVVGLPAAQRPRLVLGSALATAAIVLPTFALRPAWVPEWLSAAGRLQATALSNATGWTLTRPLTADFGPWSALVVGVSLVALVIWWWRLRPDVVRLAAATLPASVLVAPHGWSYDYIALVPTVVVAVAVASRARPPALVSLALTASVLPWLGNVVAFARNGEELSALVLVLAEGLALVVLARPLPRAGDDPRYSSTSR